MCEGTPARANDLEEGVDIGGVQFELGGELSEEENLNCCACTVPPWKRDGDEGKVQNKSKDRRDAQVAAIPNL